MNLLKILLVDDEAIILKGLASTYDWESMGFEIVGTALDGDIAIEKIKELKPDVVLTDVRMKRMSGLELMEKTLEFTNDVNFVVISAYKDFEYAQTACNQGALSYLLKPIDDAELEATMADIYEKCNERIFQKETYERWKHMLLEDGDNYLHLMRGRYLNAGITKENYIHIYKELKGTDIPEENYMVVCADVDLSYKVLSPDEYDAKRYVLLTELQKRLSGIYEMDSYSSDDGSPIFILHLNENDKIQTLKQVLAEVQKLGFEMISAVSSRYHGLEGMRKAYTQALKLFNVAMEAGAGMLTMPEKASVSSENQYSIDIENQILAAIRKNEAELLKESFVKFVYHLPESEKSAVIHMHRLIVRVEFWLCDNGEDESVFAQEFNNFYTLLDKYPLMRLIDIAYKLLTNIISQREKNVSESAGKLFGDYMQNAKNYIDEHLHEEELSITEVASQIYLNPVYFGRVFKKVFGVSFKRYVLNQRMERAKAMIMEGTQSIAGICEMVGIPNPSYFTKLFKQCTGQLPSDYKGNVNE